MRCVRFAIVAVTLALPIDAAQAQQDVWEVDGSTVLLTTQGSTIRLIFQTVGGRFVAQGATSGALLFEGERDGSSLAGIGYGFSAGCPPESYEAAGTADGISMRFSGRVPAKDSSCKIASFSEQALSFTRRQATQPPAPAPAAALPTPPPVTQPVTPPPVPQPTGPTKWTHNGSIMYLVARGRTREFYYDQPRSVVSSVGVRQGTLLFRGEFDRDTHSYQGTAYRFSLRCGPRSYQVSGPVSADMRKVTVSGQAPRIDANCNVTGYVADTLEFDFIPP